MRGRWRGRATAFGQDLHGRDGDWDLDLFGDLERAFGLLPPDDRPYRTVGDVCDAMMEVMPRPSYACDGCHMRSFHRLRRVFEAAGISRRMIRRTTPLDFLRSLDLRSLRPFWRWLALRGRFATVGAVAHDLAGADFGDRLPSRPGPGAARLR